MQLSHTDGVDCMLLHVEEGFFLFYPYALSIKSTVNTAKHNLIIIIFITQCVSRSCGQAVCYSDSSDVPTKSQGNGLIPVNTSENEAVNKRVCRYYINWTRKRSWLCHRNRLQCSWSKIEAKIQIATVHINHPAFLRSFSIFEAVSPSTNRKWSPSCLETLLIQ